MEMNTDVPQDLDLIISFWNDIANRILDWITPWQSVLEGDLKQGNMTWFKGGMLNVTYNCIDRHLPQKASHPAIIWQGDALDAHRILSFSDLYAEVCRMCHVLSGLGIKKGDKVGIYLPMIPEAAISMLACARMGAVHTVIFAGFSAEALRQRLLASDCHCLITTNHFKRGGKDIDLRKQVDEACLGLAIQRLWIEDDGLLNGAQDYKWQNLKLYVPEDFPPVPMDAEDPLFILYTSGSTGQPKGLVHTTGGYLVQAAYTFQYIFNCQADEVFWCTADVGWITGHTYVVYGPLCLGVTTLMYEGIPTWPDASRNWQIIDKYQVNVFYTAPTAIRSLMRCGDAYLISSSRASLRLLGSVGEPINPEAWLWYANRVGQGRCSIVDTWWQTETGGILISPLPGATDLKPGSATRPFFGVAAEIVDANGVVLQGACEGNLVIADSWPGQMRSVYGDHERFAQTYFSAYPGKYFTGDGARRDEDGYYWITGRVDDVINVSGHRLGTAEIESALVAHEKVCEAAVVGFPHALKGQGVYAYVTLMTNVAPSEHLRAELISWVRKEIGPIATPDVIQFAPALPKTRSGKIMRRILRKIAEGDYDALGDTSTLADPSVVADLKPKSDAR